jgi:hypothetical protein
MVGIQCGSIRARAIGDEAGVRIALFPEICEGVPLKVLEKLIRCLIWGGLGQRRGSACRGVTADLQHQTEDDQPGFDRSTAA